MIITIFGCTGEPGKELVKQCLYNGHTVRAFGRSVFSAGFPDNPSLHLINGALFDKGQVLKAVAGSHGVLSVMAASDDGVNHTLSLGIKNIVAQMEKSGVKRIVTLGNSGILKVSFENDAMIMDQEDYSPELIPAALENLKAFEFLKASTFDWTIVCPVSIKIDSPTGDFKTAVDVLPSKFASEISSGDMALFMLNELQRGEFNHCRVGISK